MTTLEAGGVVPSMQKAGGNSKSITVSGYMVNVVENLMEHAASMPEEAQRRLAFREWQTGESPILVDLGATGATVIDLHLLQHVTWYHSALRYLPADLERTLADIDALQHLEAGWNGHDVAAPRIEAIQDATEWIERVYEDVMRSKLVWHKPHVAADEHGDVTFEWWNGDKGLTIYVSADGDVSYLKDWGLDMDDEMEVGSLSTPEQRRDIWAWFVQQ